MKSEDLWPLLRQGRRSESEDGWQDGGLEEHCIVSFTGLIFDLFRKPNLRKEKDKRQNGKASPCALFSFLTRKPRPQFGLVEESYI